MSIKVFYPIEKKHNIFADNAEALVNPVNTDGYMGAGLALLFKQLWPENYRQYRKHCDSGQLCIGTLYTFRTGHENPKYIINFPTKASYKQASQMYYIEVGCNKLLEHMVRYEMNSVAIPALGCGLGGLRWDDVLKTMTRILSSEIIKGVDIRLYSPT